MIYVLNYAVGEPYVSYRKFNSWTAKHIGKADRVLEYSREDIPSYYIEEHKSIFSKERGSGLWLWKPYIIYSALQTINDGDWLCYSDSGTVFINRISHLTSFAEKKGIPIFLTEQPLLCHQFTKKEAYVLSGIQDGGENQLWGGLVLIKKTDFIIEFVKEWLRMCEIEELLSPDHFFPEIEEFSDYYAHREDQSLLTLLRIKYDLPALRDCSDYGEMPFMYANPEYAYHPLSYPESDYPTVILCNRKVFPITYFLKYCIKHLLYRCFPNKVENYYINRAGLSLLSDGTYVNH